MVTDWIAVTRVKIVDAEKLYPKGLDWELKPGINTIIGGTALGKTTLVYALQFGVFDKMVLNTGDRIEREFFVDRLTNRSPNEVRARPPTVEVHFEVAGSEFVIKRNLLTGAQIEATCDQRAINSREYIERLCEKTGLKDDYEALKALQSYLLFFGESRFLLAWENLIQNEILNLLLSDHSTYERLAKLWDEVESADSEARNISAQASRLEKDLERLEATSDIQARERQLQVFIERRKVAETHVENIQQQLKSEMEILQKQNRDVAGAYASFHDKLDVFEADIEGEFDDELLAAAEATPTIASIRRALEDFYQRPNERTCPSCGRPKLSPAVAELARVAAEHARSGHCIVCSKELATTRSTKRGRAARIKATDESANQLQQAIFKREQTRNRLDALRSEHSEATQNLANARAAEITFLNKHQRSGTELLTVTVDQMRKRQRNAEQRRNRRASMLRKELSITNAAFGKIQTGITKAFKKYATLYLDEKCDVAFLDEHALPSKKGPQIKPPHAAFFPVVSGEIRQSAQALSDAQRSFVDLAFRMAVIDVWHQQTANTMTMVIETPEGAVDIAYMDRVAMMLRTFAAQGHTLIITTNLNNDVFLPALLSGYKKVERPARILNLLEEGRPRKVQKDHGDYFERILTEVS